jgi:membrane associated rhomboid family serine protease
MKFVNDEEEEPRLTPEQYLAERKKSMRTKSLWAVGIGSALVAGHLFLFGYVILSEGEQEVVGWADLFRSIYFVLGVFALAGGAFGLREAKWLTLEDLVPTREAIEFARKIEFIKPYFSYVMVGCIVAVFITQMVVDTGYRAGDGVLSLSIQRAGLVKNVMIANGEWWRLLTGGLVHGGLMHIFFNGYALFGFGSLIEYVSNKAHLAIVMLLAILGGALASTFFMPLTPTVGASGGIMGLIGYLAVYGFRRRRQLMPGFLRAMLTNIAFIAAFGIIGFQIIDNFAHMGGLLIGAAYGFLFVPRDLRDDPREVSSAIDILGYVAIAVFVAASIFSILLIKGAIS